MQDKITSVWQDYETQNFVCQNCKEKYLGQDLLHDFEASEIVVVLDCPKCKSRVAVLNLQATQDEIDDFAAQGYKTAITHNGGGGRYYESWPDYTVGESNEEKASRMAHSIEFMADSNFGAHAVQLMQMLAFGIKQATKESPYICQVGDDEDSYYQVIRGSVGQYLSEVSPAAFNKRSPKSWIEPNQDSPNWHREYSADTEVYAIAADAAKEIFVDPNRV